MRLKGHPEHKGEDTGTLPWHHWGPCDNQRRTQNGAKQTILPLLKFTVTK